MNDDNLEQLISINNLSKEFEGNKIFTNLNLSIKKNQIIAILGPSGCGKTTMLRMICGLEKCDSESIFFKGKDINEINSIGEIGFIFQKPILFPHLNVGKNILLGSKTKGDKKTNKEIIDRELDFIGLPGFSKRKIESLSGGEAQRVALARALLAKPELLLLDEPFSNVDESLKVELQQNIKNILKEKKITTIIVTHDSYEAFYMADYCGILLSQTMKQFDTPYNIYHYPNSIEVVNFLNRGILVDATVLDDSSVEHKCLGVIKGNFVKKYKKGTAVKLLVQPDDLEHDDKSNLQLEIIDRKFRGTNFIYTLKTKNDDLIPVFVHSHHIHQHEVEEKFGIKTPIYIDHLVCF